MPYSSYNAYIVQTNASVVFAMVIVNYISSILNIRPLNYLLGFIGTKLFEFFLTCLCFYNVWYASREVLNPYTSRIRIPLKDYILKPGPIVSAVYRAYRFLITEFIYRTKPVAVKSAETPVKHKSFIDLFANTDRTPTAQQSNTNNIPTCTQEQPFVSSSSSSFELPTPQPSDSGIQVQNTSIQPHVAAGIDLQGHLNDASGTGVMFSNITSKLRYTPCIKPPLKPTAQRERILWYLSPTDAVVEDFRIQQIIDFKKCWNRFNDRYSRVFYDRMTNALLEIIFKPLAKSIDSFTSTLASKSQSLANCPESTLALSLLIPGFNSESDFSILQVVRFITLNGYDTPGCLQYVIDRVKELSSSNKMAAYRFTPKNPGMPTDTQIIVHIFKYYLSIKERHAIPPLVREEGDLFKFLLVYIYLTPELEHWKIFDKKV